MGVVTSNRIISLHSIGVATSNRIISFLTANFAIGYSFYCYPLLYGMFRQSGHVVQSETLFHLKKTSKSVFQFPRVVSETQYTMGVFHLIPWYTSTDHGIRDMTPYTTPKEKDVRNIINFELQSNENIVQQVYYRFAIDQGPVHKQSQA